jgi:putative GTP pyrophosphokinase
MRELELPDVQDVMFEYRKIKLLYRSALKEIRTKLEILNDEFKLVHQYNPIEHIESRLKTDESITRKLIRKGKEITVENIQKYIDDIAGVRVICSFTPDIYRIVDMISSQDDIEVLKTKDYMLNPKVNGYRSYHLIVRVPIFLSDRVVPTKVEIQIRTVAMDFWASLEHKIYYKYEGNTPEYIKKELKECADLVTFLDSKMLAINEEVRSIREENKE